jgi:hypothetical protein
MVYVLSKPVVLFENQFDLKLTVLMKSKMLKTIEK